jgi:lysophospholipase L1-like esterase
MIFFESRVSDLADHVAWYRVLEVALILLISEIAYRLIEKPRFEPVEVINSLKQLFRRPRQLSKSWLKTAVFFLIFLIGTCGIAVSPLAKADNTDSALIKTINNNSKKQAEMNKRALESIKQSAKSSAKSKSSSSSKAKKASASSSKAKPKQKVSGKQVNQEFEKYGISQSQLQAAQKLQVTAIGDSVMASSSDLLHKLMPNSIVDAAVSRQGNVGVSLINSYLQKGQLQEKVLIGLGTNGPISDSDMQQILDLVGPHRQIYWINVVVPTRSWQNQVNQQLASVAKKHKNFHVIDWYGYAHSNSSWFYDDKTHPNNVGQMYYSSYVVKEMLSKGE